MFKLKRLDNNVVVSFNYHVDYVEALNTGLYSNDLEYKKASKKRLKNGINKIAK